MWQINIETINYFVLKIQLTILLSRYTKKSNIPVHKKNDKQLVNNYQPASLLSTFGKIFEKTIFSRIYKLLLEENLLNPNQSGFRLSDSCVNQLLAITHEIFNHNIQSFLRPLYWLWRYHLWPTSKSVFSWKPGIYTAQSCSSSNRCHTRYFSRKSISRVRTRIV